MLDYLIDSIGTLALGLALLKREMLPAWSVLIMIAITITIRLTSQFVIKMSPLAKPHFVRDTRDIVTLMVCIGAIFSELLDAAVYIVIILSVINLWRIDNMIYQLCNFRGFSSQSSQDDPTSSDVTPKHLA